MKPYYLRFTDESEARAKLIEAGMLTKDGQQIDPGLCIIGESWRNDGQISVVDGQMVTTKQPTKRDGYFANWIGETLPEVLRPYARDPDPETPFCVFAGWSPEEIAAREAAKESLERTEGKA